MSRSSIGPIPGRLADLERAANIPAVTASLGWRFAIVGYPLPIIQHTLHSRVWRCK